MSDVTQSNFKKCVLEQQAIHDAVLRLGSPRFEDDGFSSTASMVSEGGKLELRCGPSDYHVDVIIHAEVERKRWTLVDLLALPGIRDWMRINRINLAGRQRIEAEVEYAFRLIEESISLLPEFKWLRRI